MRFLVTADHETPDRPPLTVTPGESVTVGERDTEWPAFVFLAAAHGSGWVPARHVETVSPPWTALRQEAISRCSR